MKLPLLFTVIVSSLFAVTTSADDSGLAGRVASLEARVAALEKSPGAGAYRLYCNCENFSPNWEDLRLRRLNIVTGEDEMIRTLSSYRRDQDEDGCEKALRTIPLCR